MKLKLNYVTLCNDWYIISKPNCVLLVYLNLNTSPHNILYITVNNVFLKGVPIKIKSVPNFVGNVVQLDETIALSEKILKVEENNIVVAEVICNLLDLLKIEEIKFKAIEFLKKNKFTCVYNQNCTITLIPKLW